MYKWSGWNHEWNEASFPRLSIEHPISLSFSFIQSPRARRCFTYDPIFYREAGSFAEHFPLRRQTIPLGRLELNSCWIDPRRWRSLSRIVVDRFVRTFADPFPRIRIVGASRTSFLSSTSYRLSVAGENFPRERARSSYFLRGRRIFQKMARMFESSCLWSPIENNIWISSILKMELLESCK